MNHSETIGKIAAAMVKAQKEMGSASKSANNPFFKSKYADFNEVRATVMPCLNANGIAVFQTPGNDNDRITVETTLVHESGEWVSGIVSLKPKLDDPQGAGSAITYARRYGLSAICALGSEDDDGEGAMARNKPIPKQITIGEGDVNWLVGFYKKHNISTKKLVEEFKKHYRFDPYATTPEAFATIKQTIEKDYNEAQ